MIPNRLPESVLVVDDSALQRQFMVDLCREMGVVEVLQSVDGLDAMIQLMEKPQIEVVILDLEMPGMDGVQVLHELVERGMSPAVILASGRESTLLNVVEILGKGLGLRLLGALQKPVLMEHLTASLSRFSAVQFGSESDALSPGPELDLAEVRQALRNHEFEAYFQPKVQMHDGTLTGVEALMRWRHPKHGLLLPKSFIKLIESSFYLSVLTLRMLDLGLEYCRQWESEGLSLSLSINVSALSLGDALLADAIIDRVTMSGISPSRIILEVTESAIMSDLSVALRTLARLRLSGFGLSVDDYGTGFSCMLQLERLPCTELKVDRAFVNGVSENSHLRALVESALGIAHKLDLRVVAEGVETVEDWVLLRNLGCNEAQGYLVGRPMPGEVLLSWWRANESSVKSLGWD